jgi:hypothetical protein
VVRETRRAVRNSTRGSLRRPKQKRQAPQHTARAQHEQRPNNKPTAHRLNVRCLPPHQSLPAA